MEFARRSVRFVQSPAFCMAFSAWVTLVRSVQPYDGAMNSKVSLREMSRLVPHHHGRKSLFNPGSVLIKWPAVDGWLAVADEAIRTAFASQCAAVALEQHADFQDIAR